MMSWPNQCFETAITTAAATREGCEESPRHLVRTAAPSPQPTGSYQAAWH
jgi:hypothetical protein